MGGAAHYVEAWDESNFSEYFFNSVQIAALTIIGQTVTSVMAAYAFARIDFPGRNLLFSLFLATIFIPTMVVLIPNRKLVTQIHNYFMVDFPAQQDAWGITDARRAIAKPIYSVIDALGLENFLGLGDAFTVDGPIVWPWMDNWPALVVPFLASTFSIFLLRQFFMRDSRRPVGRRPDRRREPPALSVPDRAANLSRGAGHDDPIHLHRRGTR